MSNQIENRSRKIVIYKSIIVIIIIMLLSIFVYIAYKHFNTNQSFTNSDGIIILKNESYSDGIIVKIISEYDLQPLKNIEVIHHVKEKNNMIICYDPTGLYAPIIEFFSKDSVTIKMTEAIQSTSKFTFHIESFKIDLLFEWVQKFITPEAYLNTVDANSNINILNSSNSLSFIISNKIDSVLLNIVSFSNSNNSTAKKENIILLNIIKSIRYWDIYTSKINTNKVAFYFQSNKPEVMNFNIKRLNDHYLFNWSVADDSTYFNKITDPTRKLNMRKEPQIKSSYCLFNENKETTNNWVDLSRSDLKIHDSELINFKEPVLCLKNIDNKNNVTIFTYNLLDVHTHLSDVQHTNTYETPGLHKLTNLRWRSAINHPIKSEILV